MLRLSDGGYFGEAIDNTECICEIWLRHLSIIDHLQWPQCFENKHSYVKLFHNQHLPST